MAKRAAKGRRAARARRDYRRGLDALRQADRNTRTRDALRAISAGTGEWAGMPMPLDGERLTVADGYPFKEVLEPHTDEDDAEGCTFRNSWWSRRYGCQICVWTEPDGRVLHGSVRVDQASMALRTMACSDAWGVEQEHNALHTLSGMLSHMMFKRYLLTGVFIETSVRSRVTYMFRKLRPTLALRADGDGVRILCAMCMHPVGYYQETWAGAMCPTDDVIAHLALMRGDEPMFWRRCNQHEPHRPEAGL